MWLVHDEQVIDESAVEGLITITCLEVEGIRRRGSTRGLHFGAGAQRLGPSEVRLHRHAVPVLRLERDEQRIVVSVTEAAVHAYAGGQLALAADLCPGRAVDWSVHHACLLYTSPS